MIRKKTYFNLGSCMLVDQRPGNTQESMFGLFAVLWRRVISLSISCLFLVFFPTANIDFTYCCSQFITHFFPSQISSTLPTSASPKMIDVWLFLHVALLALSFVAIIITHKIHSRDSHDSTPENNQISSEKVWKKLHHTYIHLLDITFKSSQSCS